MTAPISVGIRELKTHLGMYLERVQAGATVIITDRGRPVGRIIPIGTPLDARIQELAHAGLLAWSGRKLSPHTPVARARERKSVADLLLEDRE